MNRSLVILVVVLGLLPGLARAAETPIEDRPYTVRVRLNFEATAQFDAPLRKGILDQVADGVERCAGFFWRCGVAEETGEVFASSAALKRLKSDLLAQHPALDGADKAYFVAISPAGAGFVCTGREWDAATRQLGPIARQVVLDRRELSTAMIALLRDLFRPVAEIDQPRSGPASLRMQGGNLSAPDAAWPAVVPETLFEPCNCFLDKDLSVERRQPIPWTYLVAGAELEAGHVDCTVITGLRSPIPVKRHRLVSLALGVGSRGPETRLTLVTRPPNRRPLGGVEVELAAELPILGSAGEPLREASDRKRPVLITDRNGKVVLPADSAPENRPVWLFVRSGQVLLARVPYLPGLRTAELIELPDDSLRLELEGDVALLQAKLVDTVARRAVLLAQARARAKANQFDAADAALAALDEMPKASKFLEDLNLIRINRTKAARNRRDKSTEERTRKLCSETGELIINYLDDTKLTEVRDEVRELRRVMEDNKAAEEKAK